MPDPGYEMVNIEWSGAPPSLAEVAARHRVPLSAFDPVFGVIAVSPDEGVYSVRLDAAWASQVATQPATEGPFPDGRVEPFGPPEDE